MAPLILWNQIHYQTCFLNLSQPIFDLLHFLFFSKHSLNILLFQKLNFQSL
ncbi:hypothetical protein Hanom_Chr06g00535601 [Helianthus anomalus]